VRARETDWAAALGQTEGGKQASKETIKIRETIKREEIKVIKERGTSRAAMRESTRTRQRDKTHTPAPVVASGLKYSRQV
jgi:hypothetical protein